MAEDTMKLVLIRHGESEWNKLNLFTGWTDVELSETGEKEAAAGGRALKEAGFDFDICYTSRLKRAIHTLNFVLKEMDREWLPVVKSWKLNERHYGALQGPYTECLKDTIARAWPFFEDEIRPQMLAGKRVLIAAHGNSLRSLVMKFEKLTPEEILKVNIPTGVPLVYTFDRDFNVIDKQYIGDPETIAAKIDAVANQGKAKK